MVPLLETERLWLQPILPDDQSFIFEGLSHPAVIRFYGVSYQTLEATATQMQWYQALLEEGQGIPWKIVEKASGQNVGVIVVYSYKQEHQKAEVGFWLLHRYWYKGYALEALNAVVRYWQTAKQLHRMEAFVEEENEGSCKVLEKAGFQYEGTLRECERKNGRFVSLMIYALITVDN